MDDYPDREGALSRAREMRSMRDEGAHVGLVAAWFGYSVSSVEAMIAWHERLFPVMPLEPERITIDLSRYYRPP